MSQLEKMLPQLKTLRLSGILDTIDVRVQQAVEERLSHVEFLALLLGDEYDRRENKKLDVRLRKASFRPGRTLDDFQFNVPGLQATGTGYAAVTPPVREGGFRDFKPSPPLITACLTRTIAGRLDHETPCYTLVSFPR